MPDSARPLALAALLLLTCCGTEPASPPGEATTGESSFHLRARLRSDGTLSLWRLERVPTEPVRLHDGPFPTEDPEGDRRQLGDLLKEVHEEANTREVDGSSRVRLEFEVDPLVPWTRIQGLLVVAAHPQVKIHKITFLAGHGDGHVDLELPRDRSCCPGPEVPMVELRLTYFRTRSPAGDVTRVKASSARVTYDSGYMSPVDTEDVQEIQAGTFDLPVEGTAGDAASRTWSDVERALRDQRTPGERAVGIVSIPRPTGGWTPYRDVIAGLLLLHRLGVELVTTE